MHPEWLTNTYVVADEPGGTAVLIDAGGPLDRLYACADRERLTMTHILITHHHWDHVAELANARERFDSAAVLAHPFEADKLRELLHQDADTIEPSGTVRTGGLEIEALHTPGHTAGMLGFMVEGVGVFTGDTLFKGSVGGVRAPGHTTIDDLRKSIMDVLMKLPGETAVLPGHSEPTTIADEWENNSFVRLWRGLDEEDGRACTALGEPATLVLLGDDYDGGHKAWVRWPDGRDDIVPGSQVDVD